MNNKWKRKNLGGVPGRGTAALRVSTTRSSACDTNASLTITNKHKQTYEKMRTVVIYVYTTAIVYIVNSTTHLVACSFNTNSRKVDGADSAYTTLQPSNPAKRLSTTLY